MKTVDAGHRPRRREGSLPRIPHICPDALRDHQEGTWATKPSQDRVGPESSTLNGLGRPMEQRWEAVTSAEGLLGSLTSSHL